VTAARPRPTLVERVPQLARGTVWCHECGRSVRVDSGECLGSGWPKCCGFTMSLDSPDEVAARDSERVQVLERLRDDLLAKIRTAPDEVARGLRVAERLVADRFREASVAATKRKAKLRSQKGGDS
jgi:hypothetical protein